MAQKHSKKIAYHKFFKILSNLSSPYMLLLVVTFLLASCGSEVAFGSQAEVTPMRLEEEKAALLAEINSPETIEGVVAQIL